MGKSRTVEVTTSKDDNDRTVCKVKLSSKDSVSVLWLTKDEAKALYQGLAKFI